MKLVNGIGAGSDRVIQSTHVSTQEAEFSYGSRSADYS